MKGFKSKIAALVLAVSGALALGNAAYAEGSKDFVELENWGGHTYYNQGADAVKMQPYRLYLEWRDRKQAGGIESKNVIYVYAKAGETLYFGSSVKGADDKSINAIANTNLTFGDGLKGATVAVSLPVENSETDAFDPVGKITTIDGFANANSLTANADRNKVYLFVPQNIGTQNMGVIVNLEQEHNGPKADKTLNYDDTKTPNGVGYTSSGDDINSDKGYTPFSFIAPYTGTYAFRFLSSEYSEKDTPKQSIVTGQPLADGKVNHTESFIFDENNLDGITVSNNMYYSAEPKVIKTSENMGEVKLVTGGDSNIFGIKYLNESQTVNEKKLTNCIYFNYSSEYKNGSLSKGAEITIEPKHLPSVVRLYWKGDGSNKVMTVKQGYNLLANLVGTGKVEYTDIPVYQKDKTLTIAAKGGMRLYGIEYIYQTDPTPEPTQEPVTVEPIVWDFTTMSGLTSTGDSGQNLTATDGKSTILAANASYDSNNKGVKIDSTKNLVDSWKPTYRYIKYIAPLNGTISVTCKDNGTTLEAYVNGTKKDIESEKTKATITHINEGEEVYLYSNSKSIVYYTITFTPDTAIATTSLYSGEVEEVPYPTPDPYDGDPTRLERKINADYTKSEPWADSPSLVSAWDVTVVDKDGNVQEGRAWADVLALNAGNHQKSIYTKFYILTKDGFEYGFRSNGMQPYGFAFYANNRGFLLDRFNQYTDSPDNNKITAGLQTFPYSYFSYGKKDGKASDAVGEPPTKAELDANGNPVFDNNYGEMKALSTSILANYKPTVPGKDFNHRIFFNEVRNGNPVIKAYTLPNRKDQDKLVEYTATYDNRPQTSVLNQIKPFYVGLGGAAKNGDETNHYKNKVGELYYGTEGVGGYFQFDITTEENANGVEDKEIATYYISEEELKKLSGTQYNIKLDFSGYMLNGDNKIVTDEKGEWAKITGNPSDDESRNIVQLSTVIDGAGQYIIMWDGKDAYGNVVPKGVYGVNENNSGNGVISSYVETATVHFPIIDVERTPRGVRVSRLNNVADDKGGNERKDYLYYNNEAKPNDEELGWLYKGLENGDYPSKIGDGENRINGVMSKYGGGYYSYKKDEAGNELTDETGQKILEPIDGALIMDSYAGADVNAVKAETAAGKRAYGNYCAIDLSTRYALQIENSAMQIGVAVPKTVASQAIVSFVANSNEVANELQDGHKLPNTDDEFDYGIYLKDSHVYDAQSKKREETAANRGNDILGNTISTGFIVTVNPDDANITHVLWEVQIPLNDSEQPTLVKKGGEQTATLGGDTTEEFQMSLKEWFGEGYDDETVSLGAEGEIEDLGALPEDEYTYVSLETADMQTGERTTVKDGFVGTKALLTDTSQEQTINKGTIYKFDKLDGKETYIKFKIYYGLGTAISGNTDCSYGLVLDNIYAPNATAKATFLTMAYDTNQTDAYEPKTDKSTAEGGMVQVTKGDTDQNGLQALEDYKHHKDNEYKGAFESQNQN